MPIDPVSFNDTVMYFTYYTTVILVLVEFIHIFTFTLLILKLICFSNINWSFFIFKLTELVNAIDPQVQKNGA